MADADAYLAELTRRLVSHLGEELIAAHRRSLVWWAGYDGPQAIIAACRAWAWALEGRWLSKGDAAAWAAARLDNPAPIAKALAQRADPAEPPLSPAEVEAVLELVLAQI
jgi:hypothetical protein